MKKLSGLVFASLLFLLAGCSQDTAIVGEAVINGSNVSSKESKTVIKVDTNLLDETQSSLKSVLTDGIVIDTKQKTAQDGYLSFSLKDPSKIIGTEFWPKDERPVLNMYTNSSSVYLKSSVDHKYLAIAGAKDQDIQNNKELEKTLTKTLANFVNSFNFNFKNVSNQGEEMIDMPDGSTVAAQHVSVKMDAQEAVDVLAYILESMNKVEGLTALLQNPALSLKKEDIDNFKQDTTKMIQALKGQDVNQIGIKGEFQFDYWITSANKQVVQQGLNMKVEMPNSFMPDLNVNQLNLSVDVMIKNWNINGAIDYQEPNPDQLITEEALIDNPDLINAFAPESPIYMIANSLLFSKQDMLEPLDVEPFEDVTEIHWAFEEVTRLKQAGVVNGVGNNSFKPSAQVTRAEFIKMLVTSLEMKPVENEMTFSDKEDIPSWANTYLKTAVSHHFIEGYEDGTIRPNDKVSRAEMVTMLIRALDLPVEDTGSLSYNDKGSIPVWAMSYVDTATSFGFVQGNEDHNFEPQKAATRSESASVLYRIMY